MSRQPLMWFARPDSFAAYVRTEIDRRAGIVRDSGAGLE